MGLVQDAHAAVSRYEEAARSSALAVRDLADTASALAADAAAHGALGASSDPDVVRARALLAAAHQQLLLAAEAVDASRQAVRTYVDGVLPA